MGTKDKKVLLEIKVMLVHKELLELKVLKVHRVQLVQ